MFTTNYTIYRREMFFGTPGTGMVTLAGGGSNTTSTLCTIDIGAVMNYPRCQALPTSTYTSSSKVKAVMGVYFGSDSTPASQNDYTITSPITSGLSFTSDSVKTHTHGDGTYEVYVSYITTNTSQAEINISEIGCFIPVLAGSSETYSVMMVERTVLDEPITIPAGESRLITYKLVFNQP